MLNRTLRHAFTAAPEHASELINRLDPGRGMMTGTLGGLLLIAGVGLALAALLVTGATYLAFVIVALTISACGLFLMLRGRNARFRPTVAAAPPAAADER